MASSNAAVPPLSDLSGVAEELRRQLASANDAQLASEVGHHHQTVLSNIMLTGQESGQIAPEESLEKGSSSAAKPAAVSPVSNFKNGTDHNTSTDAQTAPPSTFLDQISAGSDWVSHHNLTPFDHQALMPDVHLAQAVHPGAVPPSQAKQVSSEDPQTASISIDVNDAPVASVSIADQSSNEDAGFSFTVPAASFTDVDAGDTLTLSATLADGSPLPAW
ncbi:MAG TPA: putative Ig domain-containing protein, partial [Aestuariivirga sp.]|nr:putative Ig domain-containing protein [Aestuariivirga sp.]